MSALDRTKRTYFYELWRAGTAGILETAATTFLLVIAVRWFAAGATAKGLVAAGGSVGLLLSPVVVSWVTAAGLPTSRAAARIFALGAASFFVAATWLGVPLLIQKHLGASHSLARLMAALPDLPVFILCSVVGMASSAAAIPLLTQMYQENYPEAERGRRFSRTVMIRIAMAALFSKLAGDALSGHIEYFPLLLLAFGGAMALASFCLSRCPTRSLVGDGGSHPLRALRFAREDQLFRRTLICWMLMGFANLMMLPLRVEYLANPKYDQALSVGMIALLTGVVPNLARLALSPVWGHLFDHMNFFALRVTLNLGFAIGILTFFLSGSLAGMIAAAVVFGISNAGGDVAWSLWVTKFAPPERVADYMSVHTFLTGVRGVLAPLAGFYCLNHLPLTALAWASAGLILAGTLLLVPEIKFGKRARPTSALVEEVSD
jgi:MFS family permease